MKKLLYFGIAFGVLLFVLVVIWVAFSLYQRLSLPDDATLYSAQWRDDISLETEQGIRKFQVLEVVCKGKYPFNTFFTLTFGYCEGEKEDGSLYTQTKTAIPKWPAKLLNKIWKIRLYVLCAEDGSLGVFDTIPTQEAIKNNPEILESLVPYDPPQQNIRWVVGLGSVNTDEKLSGTCGTGGGPVILHGLSTDGRGTTMIDGLEIPMRRVALGLGCLPPDDIEE